MTQLRFLTAGESHGPCLTVIVEGVPRGLPLLAEDIDGDLVRRQRGYGRGARMKIESDRCEITAGVRGGVTLGSPIALTITNRDFANWTDRMGAAPFAKPPSALTKPRPGHADLAGGQKLGTHDLRDVLERASARETAARTAAGAVARRLLTELGVSVFAHVVRIGEAFASPPAGVELASLRERARASDLACGDSEAEVRMKDAIRDAAHAGDTLGGTFEVVATGVPVGLGSHVHWDRKLDGRLAGALMSIPAIKAVEIGDGIAAASLPGSRVHDAIGYDHDASAFARRSNHAGGLEGGISNGEPLVCRAYMKPISTLRSPLESVDVVTKEAVAAAVERSDVCAVAAASVVGEAMVAIVLADAALEKFGGDSLGEMVDNARNYARRVREY
jgi:chorismate synthase